MEQILEELRNGKWAEYNVFFDRKVSKIYLRNSVKNDNGGKVEIYVDDSSMSGTPVATVQTTGTGSDWKNYVDTSENISIPSGNHEIYLKFVADGSKGACNLDYFQFEYEPETVSDSNDKHEAENAHAYIQGDADSEHNIQEDNAFSNGKAVGGMNAWPDNGRAYLTSYVDVKHAESINSLLRMHQEVQKIQTLIAELTVQVIPVGQVFQHLLQVDGQQLKQYLLKLP